MSMEFEHEDLCHCADYQPDCPNTCFRARLTKEYKQHEDNFYGIPITWSNFGKSATCKRQNGCPCKECTAEYCFNPFVCDKYMAWVIEQ